MLKNMEAKVQMAVLSILCKVFPQRHDNVTRGLGVLTHREGSNRGNTHHDHPYRICLAPEI